MYLHSLYLNYVSKQIGLYLQALETPAQSDKSRLCARERETRDAKPKRIGPNALVLIYKLAKLICMSQAKHTCACRGL